MKIPLYQFTIPSLDGTPLQGTAFEPIQQDGQFDPDALVPWAIVDAPDGSRFRETTDEEDSYMPSAMGLILVLPDGRELEATAVAEMFIGPAGPKSSAK